LRETPEVRLGRSAARRYSVFSRTEALEAGLSAKAIRVRLDRGLWIRLHAGLYVPSVIAIGWQQRLMGASLACGPEAVASHHSAALIWGLSEAEAGLPEVTVPTSAPRRRRGVVVHRSARSDGVFHRQFRVTHPMRTIVDVACSAPDDVVEEIVDRAHVRGLIDVERFRRYLDDPFNATKPGSGLVREVIRARDPSRPVESEIETALFRLLGRAGLPRPVLQFVVRTRTGRRRLDFAYPDRRLAIEMDGYSFHGGRRAFESDRVRQNELEELGWNVLRFTAAQVRSDPTGVVMSVGAALGLVPTRWGKDRSLRTRNAVRSPRADR